MKTKLPVIVAALAALSTLTLQLPAAPRGTASTNQGRLSAGGNPEQEMLDPASGMVTAGEPASSLSQPAASQSAPVPMDQIGAKATAQYTGDGLTVTATPQGAQLRCAFQKMDGEATSEGLWLVSTVPGAHADRFRVVATGVGGTPLTATGKVVVAGGLARFIRPAVTEEYSVSVDGVRQDFIVERRPDGDARPLRVELALTGARAEAATYGAKLTLDGFGRVMAYSRLRAVDAQGKELAATMQVADDHRLVVVMEDAGAVYPVRIDPTFSDANWVNTLSPGVPGANDSVWAMAVDGSGNLYVGGSKFTTVFGTAIASRIAKWDGSSWSALGSGLNGEVRALAASGTDLFVGGSFTTAGGNSATNIAKWDGSSWSALGSGINGTVYALAASGTHLFVGGSFTTAGGNSANNIAKWDGSSWSALGSGANSTVFALVLSVTTLYVGGDFTTAGGVSANRIAKWAGGSWSALGSGMNGLVYALAVSGADLYAGGYFTTAGAVSASKIAKWNGSAWSALGSGMNNDVRALAVSGTTLYAGGYFTTAGAVSASMIAKWNGSAWSALGSGMNSYVLALAVSGTNLYASGYFTEAGGNSAKYLAKWNGSAWSVLGPGFDNWVSALALAGTNLYAAGAFSTAGGVAVNRVAKWDGSSWSALGQGMNGTVLCLAVLDTNLYAGGYCTNLDTGAKYLAKWDGSAWSALGSGISERVFTLAVSGTNLFVGGWFLSAGGLSDAKYIAKWDGSAWSALGSGMNNGVIALAVSGTNLYAGGYFTTAGGGTANRMAKWDGSSWSALGSGMNSGPVASLAILGINLYAGGYFTTAGGGSANYIAKWDGSSWSALGSGVNSSVYALAVSGPNLYAGGPFTTAGGGSANYIAQWDGSSWSALGSGLNNAVYAFAISGTTLYMGGYFTAAGTNAAGYLVQADLGSLSGVKPAITLQPTNVTAVKGFSPAFYVSATGTAPLSYQWYFNGSQPVAGGTASSLSWPWPGVDPTNAGTYSVIVTNPYGADTSQVATLTVQVPPAFRTHPSNLTVNLGTPALLQAEADGTPAPHYQWYFNGMPVAGATTTEMGLPSAQPSNAGPYFVIATNIAGTATSKVARLWVNLALPDAFDPKPDLYAYCQAIQEDGKVLIGGVFNSVDGTVRPGLARVDTNGVMDTNFNAQVTGWVAAVAIQSDGKVLAGGGFRTTGIPARTNLARFNADGSLDASFAPPEVSEVGALVVQPDSNIVVSTLSAGVSGSCLSRLAPNGSVEASFTPPVVDEVLTVALQPDGKMLVGGKFTSLCGAARAYLGRLKADGTLDETFTNTAAADDWVRTVVVAKDGRILVGGNFTTLAGSPRGRLGRLNADGSLDSSFADPQVGSGTVVSLAVQTDGRIVVGGSFSNIGGEPRANLCQLNADGTLDSGFCPDANGLVYGVSLQPDGKVLLAGGFTQVAGQTRTNVARLNNTAPATQTLNYTGSTITWLRGGTSPEVWRTTFEASTNFMIWTDLGTATRFADGWHLDGLSLAPNAVIRARGYDVGGAYNSAAWHVRSLLSLDRTPPSIPVGGASFGMVTNSAGAQAFGFDIAAKFGQVVVVEYSDDGMVTWTVAATYQSLGELIHFTDPEPATLPMRSYRPRLR